MIAEALRELTSGQIPNVSNSENLMAAILDGQAAPEQIGALMMALHFTPPNGKLLAGFVKAFHAKTEKFDLHLPEAVDVCGTGGDGSNTFNVSTAVAFVVAASGQIVAKHGNRAVSSRCGSFDVLEELGVPFAQNMQQTRESLLRFNLAFMFAPFFHPTMKKMAPLRKSLGFRTVFNALGPLLNPAGVQRQLIGVYSEALVVPVAEALGELGSKQVMVVHGLDGSDELSISTPSRVALLLDGKVEVSTFDPTTLGIGKANAESLAGGDAKENANILRELFSGEKGPRQDIVALNAAAALVVGNKVEDLKEGLHLARHNLQNGSVANLLEQMKAEKI